MLKIFFAHERPMVIYLIEAMTPTTLVLCKKPVVGVLMWLSSMCIANQALRDSFVDLRLAGDVLNQQIDIPMDQVYSLRLLLPPPEAAVGTTSRASVSWSLLLCGPQFDKEAGRQQADGDGVSSLSMTVDIIQLDGKLLARNTFSPGCPRPAHEENGSLHLGMLNFKHGKYRIKFTNRHPVSADPLGRVQVLLIEQGAGFP